METVLIQQTLVMFLYLLIGYLLYKTGTITQNGGRELGNLLLNLVLPAVILNSFCIEYSAAQLKIFLLSTLLGALALAIALAAARLLFARRAIDQFSAAFSNVGFMGIPLVGAVLGQEAVFYLTGFVVLLNLLQWNAGIRLFCEKTERPGLHKIFLNPILLSAIVGLLLFTARLGTRLPVAAATALRGIAALNSPLAMIVLGTYLARTDWEKMFANPKLYQLCALRLLGIPLLTVLALALIPVSEEMRLAVLLGAAAPVGANVAFYAQRYGQDHTYASQCVALSTLLSIFSYPLILWAAEIAFSPIR
jgi:predicted permease